MNETVLSHELRLLQGKINREVEDNSLVLLNDAIIALSRNPPKVEIAKILIENVMERLGKLVK